MPSWPKGGDAVFARIYGAATLGLNGHVIAVETDISNGLPSFDLVGLASTSVKEAKERVRAAVKNSGYEFPMRRLTVNLAPADLKKDTSGLDLSLAVAILVSSGQIPEEACEKCLFMGELALDGRIRPVNGILPMVLKGPPRDEDGSSAATMPLKPCSVRTSRSTVSIRSATSPPA